MKQAILVGSDNLPCYAVAVGSAAVAIVKQAEQAINGLAQLVAITHESVGSVNLDDSIAVLPEECFKAGFSDCDPRWLAVVDILEFDNHLTGGVVESTDNVVGDVEWRTVI
ncbi:MAG: hypothetical protein JSR48_05020 [Verrucomicrobia bacterium]|nr:hypothetical protein [Verrucomicrobiota bacterium]